MFQGFFATFLGNSNFLIAQKMRKFVELEWKYCAACGILIIGIKVSD
jgi:hypothetical protein